MAAEGLTREQVVVPLDFSGGSFTGGVNTCGSKFGGKDDMALSAMSLTLAHAP